MLKTCARMTVFVCLALWVALPAAAQTPAATGKLIVTVADQTGAILPNATVTMVGQ